MDEYTCRACGCLETRTTICPDCSARFIDCADCEDPTEEGDRCLCDDWKYIALHPETRQYLDQIDETNDSLRGEL